jgi:fibronectin type 3 domain-containing protein
MIAFGVSSISQSVVTTDSNYVAYMYITDDTLPNPYDTLPSYFGNLVAYLDTSFTPPPPPTQISLTVNSADLSGTPITGMWTTIQSGSTTITTGFTPLNYTVTAGNQYTVTTANNQTAIFNHWDDGSTNSSRTMTPTANTVLTAYYSTGANVTVPQAPTNLSATAISSSQINLGWIAPSNTGGSPITGYKIERSTDGGATWSISNTASTPYSDTGLLSSTTYTYRVSAINSIGTSSPSNTASATTLSPPPPAPTGLVATAASTAQINLSWGSSTGATGYNILRGTTTGGPYTQAGTSTTALFSDTGLTPGTPYYYVVQATSSAGPSINSLEAAATTLSVVSSPPTGLTATTISSSQIKLSWTTPSNTGGSPITGYKIERSTDGGLNWGTIKSNTGSVITYSNTGLSPNTSYTYRVSAINSAGTSSPSNTASATTSLRNVSLIVNSVNLSGTSITGMWVELHAANGATIATGFTPKTFQVTSGTQYTVYVANYKTTLFNHWDNGSTNPGRTITLTANTVLTAYYSTGP